MINRKKLPLSERFNTGPLSYTQIVFFPLFKTITVNPLFIQRSCGAMTTTSRRRYYNKINTSKEICIKFHLINTKLSYKRVYKI